LTTRNITRVHEEKEGKQGKGEAVRDAQILVDFATNRTVRPVSSVLTLPSASDRPRLICYGMERRGMICVLVTVTHMQREVPTCFHVD